MKVYIVEHRCVNTYHTDDVTFMFVASSIKKAEKYILSYPKEKGKYWFAVYCTIIDKDDWEEPLLEDNELRFYSKQGKLLKNQPR